MILSLEQPDYAFTCHGQQYIDPIAKRQFDKGYSDSRFGRPQRQTESRHYRQGYTAYLTEHVHLEKVVAMFVGKRVMTAARWSDGKIFRTQCPWGQTAKEALRNVINNHGDICPEFIQTDEDIIAVWRRH